MDEMNAGEYRKLYIDYTHSVPFKNVKVHGGGNFAKTIIKLLINNIEKRENRRINILWPEDYLPQDEDEKFIFESEKTQILYVKNSIQEINLEPNATFYFPLLAVKEFSLLRLIKEKNKNIKLVLTIHGLRLLDLPIDWNDGLYATSFKDYIKYLMKDVFFLEVRKMGYRYYLNKYIKYCDEIFTVSNYSLSRIFSKTRYNRLTYINQDSIAEINQNINLISEDENIPNREKFMLFVSGNRPEKNLARTLKAYRKYVQRNEQGFDLIVTGVKEDVAKALTKHIELDNLVSLGKIRFKGYVEKKDLIELYRKAAFLLYTSKSEGYGLPVLEAAAYRCPSIAPMGTSVPEVLGTGAYYVSPYSIDSICAGMEWMSEKKNREFISDQINTVLVIIKMKIQLSNRYLCHLLLEGD